MLLQHMKVLPSTVLQVLVQLIILTHNQPCVLVSLSKSISARGLTLTQGRGQVSNKVVLVTSLVRLPNTLFYYPCTHTYIH